MKADRAGKVMLGSQRIALAILTGISLPALSGQVFTAFETTRAVAALTNPIQIENQVPGSGTWQLERPGFRIANDSTGQIKGYASLTSVPKGGTITFYVSVNPIQTFTIDVYRIGWYQGLGGRLLTRVGPLPGTRQPACPVEAQFGLIVCNWTRSHVLRVQDSWTSGVYLALLTNEEKYQNYIIFVVTDNRPADFLFQLPVATYQAYNNYPNDGLTGKSLYPFNSFGANTITGTSRAVKVSFDRPYATRRAYRDGGSGDFLRFDIQFVRWLERLGYDMSYSTDVDTHAQGGRLLNYEAFFSSGHDEYWSKVMYDSAQKARDSGVHLGFFGANDLYWQIRMEPSATGVLNRIIVCYKSATLDPHSDASLQTTLWRNPPVNRPEQRLIGIQYPGGKQDIEPHPYVVKNSSHWVYQGTGFSGGDAAPGIVGYEYDRYDPVIGRPANTTYTLLSQSPIEGDIAEYANSSIYRALSGAWVFAAGTIEWSWGLDNFRAGSADPRIGRTTANILNRFLL